jgi:hypothetical protein
MSFTNIKITNYGINSIAVNGNTRMYKEDLKKMGGKYDSQLPEGPGWVFPKSKEKECRSFIVNGKRLVTIEEEKSAEISIRQKAKEWKEKNNIDHGKENKSDIAIITQLLDIVSIMSVKIEWMEKAIKSILSEDQKKSIEVKIVPERTEFRVIKNKKSISVSEIDTEDIKPTKRLLGKK